MKEMKLTEQETKVLKEMVGIAVKNGNSINQVAYRTSASDYPIICNIYNKLFAE